MPSSLRHITLLAASVWSWQRAPRLPVSQRSLSAALLRAMASEDHGDPAVSAVSSYTPLSSQTTHQTTAPTTGTDIALPAILKTSAALKRLMSAVVTLIPWSASTCCGVSFVPKLGTKRCPHVDVSVGVLPSLRSATRPMFWDRSRIAHLSNRFTVDPRTSRTQRLQREAR